MKAGGDLTIADMIPKKGSEVNGVLQRLGRWYTYIPSENMYDKTEYAKKLADCGFIDIQIVDVSRDCFPGFYYYGTGKLVFNATRTTLTIKEQIEPVDQLPEDAIENAYLDWYLYSGVEEYVIVKATKPK